MSWLGEAWQEGLPVQALQGVRTLEQRLVWAHKERIQKQVQLDTLETALHKQRQKHEEERGTWALLAQERRDLAEACERLEHGHQQLSRELQDKGVQLSQLEGQLGRATQHIEELEEELQRCQAELDTLRLSTPMTHCWGSSGPVPPQEEGAELGAGGQNSSLENRPRTPSMRLQTNSPTAGEEPPLHQGTAWHSVPPGGPAPPEDNQGISPPEEQPSKENEGPGLGPPNREAWELRGALQRELVLCTEQRDQAVTKVDALQRRVQQTLEELRSWKQRAGAMQCHLEQQEREHRQELAELEQHHREALEQLVPRMDIPAHPQPPQTRSFSTDSPSHRQAGAQWHVGQGARPPPELKAVRAEMLGLRCHLAVSESLHEVHETCFQLHQGAWDQAGERRALAKMLPTQDVTMQHKGEEAQGAQRPGRAERGKRGLQDLSAEVEALACRALGPGPPVGAAQEVGELQVLQRELRALALGKAEAEAQATQAQEQLQWLQEMLGWQTERLALACEAQSQHVAELLIEGLEREQELEHLSWALREAGQAHGLLEAEVGQLWALLGVEMAPTGLPELPPTIPEPITPKTTPTVPEPVPPETPTTGPLEPPSRVTEPGPPEQCPKVPDPGPDETPVTGPLELPPTILEPSTPELPTATLSELLPIAQESGPLKLPSPTPLELPCPPELPLRALELAVESTVWDVPINTPLLVGKQTWHSKQPQLQKLVGHAGSQETQEKALTRLLQENRALRAVLALWQSQGQVECTEPATGSGKDLGSSVTPSLVPLGGRGQEDLAYVLQTSWPGAQDAQTQTEWLVQGRRCRELISAAFDHTQYEPYGLPEVVMKGFADIPPGPSCPYVLRRGLLGSTPLAQLVPEAEPEEDPQA